MNLVSPQFKKPPRDFRRADFDQTRTNPEPALDHFRACLAHPALGVFMRWPCRIFQADSKFIVSH